MTTIAPTDSEPLTRAITWLRDEVNVARLAIGVVALHVVDDNFLQPNPGTTAGDHPSAASCRSPSSSPLRSSTAGSARAHER